MHFKASTNRRTVSFHSASLYYDRQDGWTCKDKNIICVLMVFFLDLGLNMGSALGGHGCLPS